jgi:hypothetical protein
MSRRSTERELVSILHGRTVYDLIHAMVEYAYNRAATADSLDMSEMWEELGRRLTAAESKARGL